MSNLQFADSHCHIHFDEYDYDLVDTLEESRQAGVNRILAVSTDVATSIESIEFAKKHEDVWALVGVHPHEAKKALSGDIGKLADIIEDNRGYIHGIGECGLDYYYEHSPRRQQIEVLEYQLEFAVKYNLPVSFHVREAYDDFWPIFEKYKGVKGVLHSFTDSQENLEKALGYGLYIGVNGIITFSREEKMLESIKRAPLERILLETDAPYLTPKPFRGKINKPQYVRLVAEFLANLRGINLEEVAEVTTNNVKELFGDSTISK